MHRLETAQADVLLDHLGPINPGDRLLDAGCGRSGTSVMAHRRFGCRVGGVSLSRQQVGSADAQAAQLEVGGHVAYQQPNMLDTGFESGAFAGTWNNESTM